MSTAARAYYDAWRSQQDDVHPDDRYEIIGYVDANGIEHESFEAACHYYGADYGDDGDYEDPDIGFDHVARYYAVMRPIWNDDIPF